jgi:hypothetical protein
MKDENKQSAKNPKADPRQDRLKLALRENLKRRKSQARGRDTAAPTGDDAASLHDDSRKKSDQK